MTRPSLHLRTVCVDCADAEEMAAFYGRLFGWEVAAREPGWVLMRDPEGGTGLSFQAESDYRPPTWLEQPDRQDKQLHLEIKVDDLDAAVAHAVAAGARVAAHQREDPVAGAVRPRRAPVLVVPRLTTGWRP